MSKNETTVGELIQHLLGHDKNKPLDFGGLNFYRCKDRGDHVQFEFSELVYLDKEGYVVVENPELPPKHKP